MIEVLAVVAAFCLSFLGFGFLWIGKVSGEAFVAAPYQRNPVGVVTP